MNGKSNTYFEIDDSLWLNTQDLDWSAAIEGLTPKHYRPQQELFHQLESFRYVYLCKTGRIQLSIFGPNGNRRILFICDQNSIFGELSLFDNLPYNCAATVVTDAMIYVIPADLFLRRLKAYPELAVNVMKTQAIKSRLLTTAIKQMSFNDATYRVAYVLVNLINDYSKQLKTTSYKLTLKYTHQNIADLTGLSRVSVSNIISKFQNMGILKKDSFDGYIIVKDPEKLYEFLDDYKNDNKRNIKEPTAAGSFLYFISCSVSVFFLTQCRLSAFHPRQQYVRP